MAKKIPDPHTQEKIRKHIGDKNDKITAEDILNAKSDFSDVPEDLNADGTEKTIKDNADPAIQTTWNILDE